MKLSIVTILIMFTTILECEPIISDPEVTEQEATSQSGNNSTACGDYTGYTGDVQYSSQCKLAQAYACQNYQVGVDATCSIIDGFRQDNPNLPACPYCN